MRYSGALCRALNPIRAHTPLSGEGARRFGGRFNPLGTPALYLAFAPMTAIREANQAGALQPTTIVQYEAQFESLFDARDPAALAGYGLTPDDIARDDWRNVMHARGIAPGQDLALQLIADGYAGLVAPSYAQGAAADEFNLVLWVWGDMPDARLTVIDVEGRLHPGPSTQH